jgi:hypothetical protein
MDVDPRQVLPAQFCVVGFLWADLFTNIYLFFPHTR